MCGSLVLFNLILIILLIFLLNKISVLNKKLEKTKKVNFCPNCGYNLNLDNSVRNFNNTHNSYVTNNIEKDIDYNHIKKKKMSERELKNNIILIVGSILIILSSIVFLTSTWSLTHSFLKILIIVLIFGVFILSSFVAERFLSLNKTSKIFYNIAIIYIPIGLFSISSFSLLGDYLSINGEGRNIYFTFISIFISIIYYFISKKKSLNIIAYLSIIFHILGIIFFVNLFTNNIIINFSLLLIYSILFTMLYNNKIIYYNDNMHNKSSRIIGISLSVISGYLALVNLFISIGSFESILFYILIFVHSYYIYSYTLKNDFVFNIIYPIAIILCNINISYMINDNFRYLQIFIILSNILILLINFIKDKKSNIISLIYITLSSLILWSVTIYYIGIEKLLLNSVMILLSYFILILINYLNNKDKINSYCLVITSYILIINIICLYDFPTVIVLYFSLLLLLINLLNKIKSLELPIKYISLINSFIFILYSIFFEMNNIYFLIFIVIYYFVMFMYYYLYNDEKYKIISYICMYIAIISISSVFELGISNYSIFISSLIILILEKCFNNKSKKVCNLLLIEFIINYIILLFDISLNNFILLIFTNIIFVLYMKYYKKNNKFYYLVFGSLIPYLYLENFIFNYNYVYFISLFVISLIVSLIWLKKSSVYYLIFYVFLIFHLFNLSSNVYIDLGIGLLGTYIIYKTNTKYNNDIFKCIMYFISLLLYKNILNDLDLTDIAIIDYGIYILLIILLSRTIFIKYNNHRIFEYVSLSLLYLITLFNYSSEIDGIMFVFLMLAVVIISYLLKYGPIFIVSLIAILLNVFILTRVFWLNIPWWIYILIIGIVLVVFAIRNETKEKNNVSKEKFDEFKNKMNL